MTVIKERERSESLIMCCRFYSFGSLCSWLLKKCLFILEENPELVNRETNVINFINCMKHFPHLSVDFVSYTNAHTQRRENFMKLGYAYYYNKREEKSSRDSPGVLRKLRMSTNKRCYCVQRVQQTMNGLRGHILCLSLFSNTAGLFI